MAYLLCFTRYVLLLISTAANIYIYILDGVQYDILSKDEEMARIRSNVIYVALLCLSPRLCKWSKSTQRRGKVTQALPLAQPVSALKLRQAVIINEETWANGQEMQRYWLGWLPCSKLYRLAPAWWPVVSQAAACGVGGSQSRCETRPPLAAVCHIQATPEGRSTGDGTKTKKSKTLRVHSQQRGFCVVPGNGYTCWHHKRTRLWIYIKEVDTGTAQVMMSLLESNGYILDSCFGES